MLITKIKIKMGSIEIDYEGEEQFLKDEFPKILIDVSKLIKETGAIIIPSSPLGGESAQPLPAGNKVIGTLNTIAGKLSVKTGPDLVVAAAGSLTLVKNMPTFSRDQLLTEMKTASGYFNTGMTSNYSAYLKTLVKTSKLSEVATNTYALTATQMAELESRLAV